MEVIKVHVTPDPVQTVFFETEIEEDGEILADYVEEEESCFPHDDSY